MNTRLMDQAEQARDAIAAATKPLLHEARRAAGAARAYARASPWAVLGVAISAGVLLGFLAYRARR